MGSILSLYSFRVTLALYRDAAIPPQALKSPAKITACVQYRPQDAQISKTHPTTISAMPSASRALVGCLKAKREIACAKITSTSAKVRTLAAVASAKARNQNCDASAPTKPAKSDGFHARSSANITVGRHSDR